MDAKQLLFLGASLVAATECGQAIAQEMQVPYVQVAEIEVDATQLEQYKAAVHEQIETAIRVEAGVLVFYAVADKDSPTHVRVFEIYADKDAYQSHLQSAHFKKYKTTTEKMVRSLKLVQTVPIGSARRGSDDVPSRISASPSVCRCGIVVIASLCGRSSRLVTIGVQRVFEDVKPAYEAASGLKLNVEFASTQDIVDACRRDSPPTSS